MYFSNFSLFEKPQNEFSDFSKYEKFRKVKARIEKNLLAKFNFINIMYEISRIQMAI